MNSETKTCQNCKQSFVIEPEDFQFYEKIKVPPPTFCPDCRLIRRLSWRNERSLYKRKCDLCGKEIIAMYPTDAPFPVYCHECYQSDKWDAMDYGRDYDFSKTFFQQFKELRTVVPRANLWQFTVTNSPYTNIVRECKESYLSFSLVGGEKVYYSKTADGSFRVFDCLSIVDCENTYENIYGDKNYNSYFLVESKYCIDSWFLYDCVNCKNCALSVNLRNKEYVLRDRQYTKEEYFRELERLNLGSTAALARARQEFEERKRAALHKYADITKSLNSTGDHIRNAKNAKSSFDIHDVEDIKHCFRVLTLKDAYDCAFFGVGSELIYEYISGGKACRGVKFSTAGSNPLKDVEYTDNCSGVGNSFGCVGLRDKEYCVLNKRYSPEAYRELVDRIKQHMNQAPYTDYGGRIYKYGEFFPTELSPFGYNETIAQEYFPLTKDETGQKGYRWRDPDMKNYRFTVANSQLPDHIKEAQESITNEIIECGHQGRCNEQCTFAFRIVPEEFQFYRQFNISLPRLCPNCRHYGRIKRINPMKLWKRRCVCDYKIRENSSKHAHHPEGRCPNEFETPYSPERPEIVYCEQCYNAEVV